MKTDYARKVSRQALTELVEAVDAGKSQKLVNYLKAMGKFHNYSLGNAIMIGFQKPDATKVAGFRAWQKLGRHVKKSEKGIYQGEWRSWRLHREAVAFVVCQGIGLDTNGASSDYIQLYNGDKETLMQSLERVQRTAAEILTAVMADRESEYDANSGEVCVAVAA